MVADETPKKSESPPGIFRSTPDADGVDERHLDCFEGMF